MRSSLSIIFCPLNVAILTGNSVWIWFCHRHLYPMYRNSRRFLDNLRVVHHFPHRPLCSMRWYHRDSLYIVPWLIAPLQCARTELDHGSGCLSTTIGESSARLWLSIDVPVLLTRPVSAVRIRNSRLDSAVCLRMGNAWQSAGLPSLARGAHIKEGPPPFRFNTIIYILPTH